MSEHDQKRLAGTAFGRFGSDDLYGHGVDYTEYGGAPLLGVKGNCIICHGRSNANAIKNAIRVAAGGADLVLGGYRNPIPLDETIDAVFAVGRMLPAELRCTARGGLAVTPSALRLQKPR